jgi:hypothetical protein
MMDTTKIGSRLEVTPVTKVNAVKWVVDSPSLPKDWSCYLINRASTAIIPGMPLKGWILNVNEVHQCVEVTDSNFGFLPISDRMRPRYVASLSRLAVLIEDQDDVNDTDAEIISEVKGMFSRCARRDQWDWYAVSNALGELSRVEARRIATFLGEISTAIRRGDIIKARERLKDTTAKSDFAHTLKKASIIIRDSVTTLPKSRTHISQSVKLRGPASKPISIVSTYNKEKLDLANVTHTTLLDVLGQFLGIHGYRVETNQFIDAFTRLKSGPAIFEAKSLTNDNELAQIRYGLSQLYEYRYRYAISGATLWLVLSRAPVEDWVINYL